MFEMNLKTRSMFEMLNLPAAYVTIQVTLSLFVGRMIVNVMDSSNGASHAS